MDEPNIKFGKTTVNLPSRQYIGCKHLSVEMDDDAQLMQCTYCKKYLSAYTWLRARIADFTYVAAELKQLKAEVKLQYHILSQPRWIVR